MFTKENITCCCIFTIIAALVVSIGVGALFASGGISSIPVLYYLTLSIAILSGIFVTFNFICKRRESCFCLSNLCLIASIIGAIITTIFALTASTSSAILVGAITFFLVTTFVYLISWIICLICTRRCD